MGTTQKNISKSNRCQARRNPRVTHDSERHALKSVAIRSREYDNFLKYFWNPKCNQVKPGTLRKPYQLNFDPPSPTEGGIEEYLEEFNANTRRVMKLRFNHGLGYEEIGERVGMNQGSVKLLIEEAIEHLRGRLSDD